MGDVCGSLAFFLSKSKGTVNTVTSPISKLEKCVIVGALQCALPPWRRFFIGEHNPTGFTFGFNKEGAVPLNKF